MSPYTTTQKRLSQNDLAQPLFALMPTYLHWEAAVLYASSRRYYSP